MSRGTTFSKEGSPSVMGHYFCQGRQSQCHGTLLLLRKAVPVSRDTTFVKEGSPVSWGTTFAKEGSPSVTGHYFF